MNEGCRSSGLGTCGEVLTLGPVWEDTKGPQSLSSGGQDETSGIQARSAAAAQGAAVHMG